MNGEFLFPAVMLPEVVLGGGYQVERLHAPDNNLEAVFRYLVQER